MQPRMIPVVAERGFKFAAESAAFVAVLHRLMVSGSDRAPTTGVAGKLFQVIGIGLPSNLREITAET